MQLGKLKTVDFLKWNNLYWFNYMISWRSLVSGPIITVFFFSILFCISFKYFVSLISIGIWPIIRKGERICYFLALVSVFKSFNSMLLTDCRTSLALVVCPCIHAVVVYMMHSCSGWLLCGVFPASHQNSYILVLVFIIWLHQSI